MARGTGDTPKLRLKFLSSVSGTVVSRLIAQRTLPASQVMPQAPWIIKRTDLALTAVQAEVEAVKSGRPRPQLRSEQPELPLLTSRPETLCPEPALGGE